MPNRWCISFRQKDKSLKCLWYYRSVLHSHEDKTQRTFSLKLLSEMDPSSASDVNTQQKLMQCIDYSEWKQKSLTSAITTACNFPVDQAQSIDISTFKRVKVSHVDSLIQHLWSHVPIKTITHGVKKTKRIWKTGWSAVTGVHGHTNLLVPTLWLGAMSMVSVAESCRTAKPRSAMAQVQFFFTRMFLDLRSLWAMPGFPISKDDPMFKLFNVLNLPQK